MKCETHLLQDFREFEWFLFLIAKQNVGSYLEIGSKHGGSFWRIANSLPRGSRVVSIDLPHGDGSFKNSEPNLVQCVRALITRGYDAHLLLGDSTDQQIISKARTLAPFDLCFIDGHHSETIVRSDWENYGLMSKMVAFHDIAGSRPGTKKDASEVPKVWNDIKRGFIHREAILRGNEYGIGVLWRS